MQKTLTKEGKVDWQKVCIMKVMSSSIPATNRETKNIQSCNEWKTQKSLKKKLDLFIYATKCLKKNTDDEKWTDQTMEKFSSSKVDWRHPKVEKRIKFKLKIRFAISGSVGLLRSKSEKKPGEKISITLEINMEK